MIIWIVKSEATNPELVERLSHAQQSLVFVITGHISVFGEILLS